MGERSGFCYLKKKIPNPQEPWMAGITVTHPDGAHKAFTCVPCVTSRIAFSIL